DAITLSENSPSGFPIAFRSCDDCALSPYVRRCLEECHLLEGMGRLRLLNFQHNLITHIHNLSHLRHLAFLDLYDNHISQMSGISALASLRVLMLGKNRIQRICSLDNLTKIDILDLHGNQISQIGNLSHLSELRVLNLAGNCISRVDNLQGLDSLTEINLRRNCISTVTEVDQLPCLQRLFLSCNSITSFYELACLGESCSLSELTLDGNPVALETWYKQAALRCVLQLRQLDMKRVTEEERRMACVTARKEDEKKRESHKQAMHKVPDLPYVDSVCVLTVCFSVCSRLLEAGGASLQSLSLSDSHLAELDGETLRLFGLGALEALERGWGVQTAGAVTVIAFRYIHFDAIVPTLPRIRVKFPNLSHLIFLETNVSRLPQLAALAQVRRLDQLTIHPKGNPVVSLSLWRSFLIYRLHHFNLHKINNLEVTMNDVISAERLFGTLGHIAATETPRCRLLVLLEESRKRQLQFLLEGRGRRAGLSPEELRDNGKLLGEGLSRALFNYPNITTTCHCIPDRTSDTNLKGESLHKLWPSMFMEMVRDYVLEMRDRPTFRQACLNRLSTQGK
uniref:Leucine rich repeat containing 49 n=1 Tax=Oncorhynchus kisutch TaxID=8019 RepID=A0A8C7G8W3_ONCKI